MSPAGVTHWRAGRICERIANTRGYHFYCLVRDGGRPKAQGRGYIFPWRAYFRADNASQLLRVSSRVLAGLSRRFSKATPSYCSTCLGHKFPGSNKTSRIRGLISRGDRTYPRAINADKPGKRRENSPDNPENTVGWKVEREKDTWRSLGIGVPVSLPRCVREKEEGRKGEGERNGREGGKKILRTVLASPRAHILPRCLRSPRVNVGEWGTTSVGTKLR